MSNLEVLGRDAALVVAVSEQVDGLVYHLGILEAADHRAQRDQHASGVRANSSRLAHHFGAARVEPLELLLGLRITVKQPANIVNGRY